MPQIKNPTFEEIWSTLSVINVNNYTEEKYGLTFLSWGFCWALLMKHFPQAQYAFDENEIHPDGSVTVYCTVTIGECSRSQHLPVMNHKMAAIQNPTSRDISDAKQRALVKAISMHGLGAYLYCGEKAPADEGDGRQQPTEAEAVPDAVPAQAVGSPASETPSPAIAENEPSAASEATPQPVYEAGDEGYLPDSEQAAQHWAEVTVKFIEKHCDDPYSLDALWETDKETITHVENHYPTAYAMVQAGFKQRYTDLKEST